MAYCLCLAFSMHVCCILVHHFVDFCGLTVIIFAVYIWSVCQFTGFTYRAKSLHVYIVLYIYTIVVYVHVHV